MQKQLKKFSVNIVIPVYNEEKELAQSIHTLVRFLTDHLQEFRWFIVIADNASTDSTLAVARELAKSDSRIQVFHMKQKGRGRAVKYAWQNRSADFYAYMDVDLSTDLKHFPTLVQSLMRGYDLGIGSRNAIGARVYGRSLLRTFTSKMYMMLIKCFFWVHFSDAQCGFKVVSHKVVTDIIPKIKDDGWFFDTELLILAEKTGLRIYDEPVTWIDNPGSTVKVFRTAQGDIEGLYRLFITRPWRR